MLLLGCLPLLATGLDLGFYPTMVLWVLAGACQAFLLPIMVVVNLTTPPGRRGAVNGLAGAGFNLAVAGAFLAAGLAADKVGPANAVFGAGVLGLVLTGAAYLFWPAGSLARVFAPAAAPVRPAALPPAGPPARPPARPPS